MMMSPTVEQIILACLAAAPAFDDFEQVVKSLGFVHAHVRGPDQRWMHEDGREVMLTSIPDHTVCSVWFDGEYPDEAEEVNQLLQAGEYANDTGTDGLGVYWPCRNGQLARLVVKEGVKERVGFALFVPRRLPDVHPH